MEAPGNQKTRYNLVEVSEGAFRGLVKGVDPHDNSEIGTLRHDAWTYWGHSGAPLLRRIDGTLIGLHSSWDDKTAMMHGVPLVAIEWFVKRHLLELERVGGEIEVVGENQSCILRKGKRGGRNLGKEDGLGLSGDKSKETVVVDLTASP